MRGTSNSKLIALSNSLYNLTSTIPFCPTWQLQISKLPELTFPSTAFPHSSGIYHLSGSRTYTHSNATIVCIPTRSSIGADIEVWGECTPFGTTYAPSHVRGVRVPIIFHELATDKASLVRMISDNAAEGIALKIPKADGLARARQQRYICFAAGYALSVKDATGSDIVFAAVVHLAQTVPERNMRSILNSRGMVTVKTADTDFGNLRRT